MIMFMGMGASVERLLGEVKGFKPNGDNLMKVCDLVTHQFNQNMRMLSNLFCKPSSDRRKGNDVMATSQKVHTPLSDRQAKK